jgi:hypothetical protein
MAASAAARSRLFIETAPARRDTPATLIQPPAPIVMADMRTNAAADAAPPAASVAPPVVPPVVASSPTERRERPSPFAASSVASDNNAIADVLERYRTAASALDAQAVAAVWPTTNARGLTRAFNQLISQEFSFAGCTTDVSGAEATSTCQGQATYIPRVGSKNPRIEPREWLFGLRKDGDRWLIDRVTAR